MFSSNAENRGTCYAQCRINTQCSSHVFWFRICLFRSLSQSLESSPVTSWTYKALKLWRLEIASLPPPGQCKYIPGWHSLLTMTWLWLVLSHHFPFNPFSPNTHSGSKPDIWMYRGLYLFLAIKKLNPKQSWKIVNPSAKIICAFSFSHCTFFLLSKQLQRTEEELLTKHTG